MSGVQKKSEIRKAEKNSLQGAELLQRIQEAIYSRSLFRRGQSILIAVSGGLDSSVLLHVLHNLAPIHKWRLMVAHLNHCLRGRSSDADERLVRKVCKQLALPLLVERCDVRNLAHRQKVSIEMAARLARHDFLVRAAAKKKVSTIAFAHHADDQVELFFIRLLRGSGGEGLGGMKWRGPAPFAKAIQIVRPLLGEPKSALREYAVAKKVLFREDATNASLDIQRNRIRHELLPLLRRYYQSALNKIVLRLMEIVGDEARLIGVLAEDWLRKAKDPRFKAQIESFLDLPKAIQRRCLQRQFLGKGFEPDFELIERLRLTPNCSITINRSGSKTRRVFRAPDGLLHWNEFEPVEFNSKSRKLSLGSSGRASFDGINIAWRSNAEAGWKLPKAEIGTENFDAEIVGSRVTLRHWQTGDRFQPIGMPTAVKLQDLFVNQKVPRALRHKLVVAESEKGEIFWVERLRISERFKLTKATKRRLQWQWKRD